MNISSTSTHYSRILIKFTATEFKSTIKVETTRRIIQITKLSLYKDITHITTNKEATQ